MALHVSHMTKDERENLGAALFGSGGKMPDTVATISPPTSNGKRTKQEAAKRPIGIHIRLMQVLVYAFAYIMLALGWLVTHIGQAASWIGHEAKESARSID